jgi:hypothetical protein
MSKKALVKLEFKKHVAAIHTSGELTLLERKIVNVLLLNAYDDLLTKRSHSIPVKHMAELLGWDVSHNVERLQDALRRIVRTSIEFNVMEDGHESWEITSLLSHAKIRNGICTYKYVEELAERLFDPEVYATINIGMQRRFKGGYSLTLYENCFRYKATGSTGLWEIDKFRRIMGATAPMYGEFKRLSHFVINKAVDEINRQSDIHLTPEYQRIGRKVAAVKFLIRENAQIPLLAPEHLDGNEAIRAGATYARLREHGIGDKLAVAWIVLDGPRAKAVVEYVEDKDRKKQVKGSTGGYIRKLIEEGGEVGKPAYEAKKEEAERTKADEAREAQEAKERKMVEDAYLRARTTATLKGLTIDERRGYAESYIDGVGADQAKSYQADRAEFKDSIEKLKFSTWLRLAVSKKEIDPVAFTVWVEARKQGSGGK